jgi:hypothetical protein
LAEAKHALFSVSELTCQVRQADIGVAEADNISLFTARPVGSSGVGPGRLLVTNDGDWKTHAAEVDRRKPLINHGKTTADLVWTIDKESIMGFTEPNFPRVEPEAFLQAPFLERVKTLTLNWVENGYGVPRMVHAIYIVKLVFFYALGGIVVATLTSGLPAFWHALQRVQTDTRNPRTAEPPWAALHICDFATFAVTWTGSVRNGLGLRPAPG